MAEPVDVSLFLEAMRRVVSGEKGVRIDGAAAGVLSHQFDRMIDLFEGRIEKLEAKLFRHLYHDELTDLPNRQQLMNDMQQYNNPVLLLANIDHFKEINDFYGNIYGDYLLMELANRLDHALPVKHCKLYKMPADEYAFLFEKGKNSEKKIVGIARKLLDSIAENPIVILDNDIYIKLTFGIAIARKYGEDTIWLDMLKDADIALKTARKDNREILVFDQSMGVSLEYENNLRWVKKLKEAIREDRIVPYYQPIHNNHTGRVEKYECLARMIERDGTVVNPSFFLDVAKKSKMYSCITTIMIDKCFEHFKNTAFEFSLNLSALDILDRDTNRYILEKVHKNPEVSCRLVFEILESEGIENYDAVHDFITEVKSSGCKIAIDDFGTGYSNFDYVLKLDVDYIKIDASLTKNLEKDRNSQIITKTIADFSRKLGVKTISEYVHSREVFDREHELGVDYSQGYYFGEPREEC